VRVIQLQIKEKRMNRRLFTQLALSAGVSQVLSSQIGAAALPARRDPKFSVMLWTLEKQAPFDQCLEIVAKAGFQGVELVGENAKWSPEETSRIMAKMRALGLTFDMLSGVKSGFADPAGTDGFLAELKAQINTAKQLHSPQINLKSGPMVNGLSRSVQHAACIENLKRAADLATSSQIQIVIEPIDSLESPEMYLTSVGEGFEIVRAVNSPMVKVLYDFYHEQRGSGNLIEKLEQNFGWVGLVHIADVPGRHEPGTGEMNYQNIYRKLGELKYDKFITMEFYPTIDPVIALTNARLEAQKYLATT
jgi:hydroxypyruvate isomerase